MGEKKEKKFNFGEKKDLTVKSLKDVERFLNNFNKYYKPFKIFKMIDK